MRRRSRPAPLGLTLLTLSLGAAACGGDPTIPTTEPDTGSAPAPAPDVPTTDADAGLDPADFTNIDRDTAGAPADAPSLTAEEVAELEASALEETGHDVVMSMYPTTVSVSDVDTFAWEISTFGADEVAFAHVEGPGEAPLGSQSGPMSNASEGLQGATQRWTVGISEAVTSALEVRPGEVLGTGTTNDIVDPLMAIGIRQDDGALVRITVDGESGDVLNAVELGGTAQAEGGSEGPLDGSDIPTDQHDS
ncbi:hypothetical protein ACPYO6_12610 [Georgenia sp. Z1344]|uniref:hypothetical protein n=1 Tax=Georgenia sp. Z1344 TaxID=3416706 RepID=UPI003CF04EF3